jgi:MFS family permease
MPLVAAPIAGILSDRIGGRPLLVAGLGLMAAGLGWLAVVSTPTVEYLLLVPAFVAAGIGMGFFFPTTANLVLSAVRPEEEGKASGVNNMVREVGGVLGVAVLASVFSANGSYVSGISFVDGLRPALVVGAIVVAVGSVAALAIPGRRAVSQVREALAQPPRVGAEALELEPVGVRIP